MKARFLPAFTLCVTLLATVVVSQDAAAEVQQTEVEGIHNFSTFSGSTSFAGTQAGFGGATDYSAMDWLAEQGFLTVISLRLADEENADVDRSRQSAENAGLNYVHIPFDPENPAPGSIDRFLQAAADPSNQPVYIHCGSATRAAAFWMVGRMTRDGLDKALAEQEGRAIAEKPEDAIKLLNAYIALQNE